MAVEPWRFCAVVADSTGNTLASRRLLVKHQIPLAIMLGDCVHHLNRGIGDIGKLAAFQSVIQVVRATVALFHKSHAGHAALKVARSQLGIGRGLEAIGKTRFATLVLSAASVQRNTPAIKKVVNSRAVTFKTIEDYFQVQSTRKTSNFESGLEQFLCIGLPVAKAIACLEALDATAADVYIYWHAILYALGAALTNQRLEYEGTIIEEVTGIMNARYRQLFEDGNIANDVYLAATYLNPNYLRSDLFKDEDADPNLEGIRHPTIFKRITKYLSGLADTEIRHGQNVVFTKWVGKGKTYKAQFRSELLRYARHQYPFSGTPLDEGLPHAVMQWWRTFAKSEHAVILPAVAMKIYSVRVNSMPEERTVSTFTALTPKLRSRLSVQSMTAMTQIRQYYQTEAKKTRPHVQPNLRFHHIKKKLFPTSDAAEDPMPDDDGDDWIDEPPSDDISLESDLVADTFVNMHCEMLRDILADHSSSSSRDGVSRVRTGPGDGGHAVSAADADDDDDDDFEITF